MNHDDPHPRTDEPTPPAPPPPFPPGMPLLLADVAPGRDLAGTPVTTPDGDTLVVLDYDPCDVALSEVWSQRNGVQVLPSHTPVTPVHPPELSVAPLRRALAHLVDRVRALTSDRNVDRAHHQRRLEDIRCYAIDRHLDGCYDREDLNAFLSRFDLPPYQPRFTVAFTITGTYQVQATDDNDEASVREDAEDDLRPDLRLVPWVVDSSDEYDVTVTEITREDERARDVT